MSAHPRHARRHPSGLQPRRRLAQELRRAVTTLTTKLSIRLGARTGSILGVAVVALSLTVSSAAAAGADELGIDVSRYQHNPSINWASVAGDHVSFAFIKASEGVGYTNPYFTADWTASAATGVYRGAYHFARPDTRAGDAAAEARYFVSVAGPQNSPGDLPPVLDLETTGGLSVTALTAWTKTWLSTVEDLTGRTPIIYVSPSFWETYLGNSQAFTRYPLWIAHYGVSSPRVPGGWPTWTFWQGTSSGRVTGITGSVDMNAFHGTLDQLRTLALAAPAPAPSPGPTPSPAATTSTLSASRRGAWPGQHVQLSGSLVDHVGAPVPNRPVTLETRTGGPAAPWTSAAKLTTDTSGSYATSVQMTAATDFRVVFAGGPVYEASTSPVATVRLRPKRQTVATFTADHAAVPSGTSTRLHGHLTTEAGVAVTAKTLRIYAKRPRTTDWHLVGSTTSVAPTGWYQIAVTPTRTTVYRSVYDGGQRYSPDTSNRVRVTVD